MSWEERFWDLSTMQEGLVARFQLPMIGCTLDDWRAARRSRHWDVPTPRLVAVAGAPESTAQRVMAAVLDTSPYSALHGPSTLAWFGIRRSGLRDIQVMRPRGVRSAPSPLATVHRVRAMRAQDVMVYRGVVTETPLRAIWAEAARYAHPGAVDFGAQKIGRLVDDAHKLDLLTWDALHESVDDLQQRGRAGTVIMRALASVRLPGMSPTESRQEDRFEKILADEGVEPFLRQRVLGGTGPIGRSDHRDRVLPLAVEINSELHHSTPSDRRADEERAYKLNDAGFTVSMIWETDLWQRPRAVLATVHEARRLARGGARVVLHSPGCPWPDPLLPTHRILPWP